MPGQAQTFNFTVKLTDQVSSTAKNIQGQVQTTANVLRSLEIQVKGTFSGMNAGAGSAAGGMDLLAGKAGILLGVIKAIGSAVAYAFHQLQSYSDKSLEFFSSREGQIKSYEQLFKDRDLARFEYGRALNIGQQTVFTSADVLKVQRQLAVGGIRGQQGHDLLAGILDLGTAGPDEERSSILKRSAYAIKEIQTMGKLRSRQLNTQLGTAGLDVHLVHQAIAEGRGFKADKNSKLSLEDQQSDYVEKLLRKGQVRSAEGLRAIQIALSRQFNDGGKLGGFARNQAGTIASLQSNRDEALENLRKSFDADILPAVRRYKDALKGSADAMNVNTQSGQNLRTVLADIANTGIGLKAIFEEFTGSFVQAFGESYVAKLKEMGITTVSLENKLTDAAAVARDLGKAFGQIGGSVAWVIHQFDKLGKVAEWWGHGTKAREALFKGDVKTYLKEAGQYLGGKTSPDTSHIETAAQAAARAQKEIEMFSYQQAGSKGGGANKGGSGKAPAIKVGGPSVAEDPGSGSIGGHGGGGHGGGGGGGASVYRSGGLKIGTMHLEIHLGHGVEWNDQTKQMIRDEAPGAIKEMFERVCVEMGV